MGSDLLVSTRKGLFHFVPEGSSYRLNRVSFLAENVTNAHVDLSDGTWYAALNLGHFGCKFRRSSDQGATWTECAAPAYPEGETVPRGDGKPPDAATLKLIWVMASSPGVLWAGTLPGGLFKSADRGDSWTLIRGLWDRPERAQWFGGGADHPGINSICINPRDPNVIRIGISCGGVWQTGDGGQTWQQTANGMSAEYMPPEMQSNPNIQDVHRMVQCPAAPDRLWVQHHNAMYRSIDGGHNWLTLRDVPPSVFGFAVAVHPHNPDAAWYIPAVKDERRVPVDGKLVVTRTRDGGGNWEVLRNGLPQENAYDLIFRHCLDVDDTGDRLAFGSTTGGLWHTHNGGDSWQLLPARLPPIYAVQYL
jgi:hypothetical protein